MLAQIIFNYQNLLFSIKPFPLNIILEIQPFKQTFNYGNIFRIITRRKTYPKFCSNEVWHDILSPL